MAQFAHADGSGSEEVILLAATRLTKEKSNAWYLDTSYNNHMTGNKNWFINIDELVSRSIRFTDKSIVTSEGIRNIIVKKN